MSDKEPREKAPVVSEKEPIVHDGVLLRWHLVPLPEREIGKQRIRETLQQVAPSLEHVEPAHPDLEVVLVVLVPNNRQDDLSFRHH